jgi:polyhydroxybutyrate depolymerase
MHKFRSNYWRYLGLSATCLVWMAVCPMTLEAKCKPGAALAPGDHVINLDFEGKSRTFTVHIPPKYDGRTPVPIVFDLHGSSGNGPSQLAASGFKQVSDMYNFIVVAPTGYMNFWNGDIAFGTAFEMKINDVGFMKAVVNHLAGIANINRGKVYSTGLSNGGAMSNTLGCQAADTFAGIAPVADPLDIGLATCKPVNPISVLGFHGYNDDPVPYEGGKGSGPDLGTPFPSIPDTLKAWAKIMQCTGDPEVIPFEGMNKCEIYRECGGDAQVGYCSLVGGHNLYSQTVLNIADYAWKFFDQFSLPLPDADGDHIGDEDDNCVQIANPDQADADGDCIGDACECETPADCDNGKFCDGSEICKDGVCDRGPAPCESAQTCDESSRKCLSAPSASGAAGATGNAGETANAGRGGSATTGTAGMQTSSAPIAGSPGATGTATASATQAGASAAAGASGSDGAVAQSPASGAKSGCSCRALGSTRESPALPNVLALLGIGLLLSWRSRRR